MSAYKSDKAGNVQEGEVVVDTFVEHDNEVDGKTAFQSPKDQPDEAVTGQRGGQVGGDQFLGSTDSQEQLASGDEMVDLSVQVSLNADNPEDGNMISGAKLAKTNVGSVVPNQVPVVSSPETARNCWV